MQLGADLRATYGNALIRIELRPQAWIATTVLAEPERIAAIFHVRTEAAQGVRFREREYVVCSTAMVSSWSVATPAIRAELDAEVAMLRVLRECRWHTCRAAPSSSNFSNMRRRAVCTCSSLVT